MLRLQVVFLLTFFVICLSGKKCNFSQNASRNPQMTENVFRKDYVYVKSMQSFYKAHKIPLNFHDARRTCKYEGSELALPKTADEATVLRNIIGLETVPIWIGLHDVFAEGEFVSLNGTNVEDVYHKWATNEPNNANDDEDCIVMDGNKEYNDVSCNDRNQFICSKQDIGIDYNWICETYDKGFFYNVEGDRCYKLHHLPTTWNQAYKICRHEEAKLAMINSPQEAKILSDYVNENQPAERLKGTFDKANIFLDINDLLSPGIFRTSDGLNLMQNGYEEWAPGQPDNSDGNEHCGSMLRNGKLNDINCQTKAMFFCEKTLGPPLTFTLLKRVGYHDTQNNPQN